MGHDPSLLAETREWLIKAEMDLRSARHDLSASPPLHEDILFHCQQACEKNLKSFLVWHGQVFRKTHSLEELGEQCLAIDESLRAIIDRIVPLTEYAWKFRYPGETGEATREDALGGIALAEELSTGIRSRLPKEASPSAPDPRGDS